MVRIEITCHHDHITIEWTYFMMSNLKIERDQNLPQNPSEPLAKDEYHKQRWQTARRDLKQAIAEWDTLSQAKVGPNPEDVRLTEMRTLLSELKTKLDALESSE